MNGNIKAFPIVKSSNQHLLYEKEKLIIILKRLKPNPIAQQIRMAAIVMTLELDATPFTTA